MKSKTIQELALLPLHQLSIKFYQDNCRIYLDEYNVEEWDFVSHFDTSFIAKRFLVKE